MINVQITNNNKIKYIFKHLNNWNIQSVTDCFVVFCTVIKTVLFVHGTIVTEIILEYIYIYNLIIYFFTLEG